MTSAANSAAPFEILVPTDEQFEELLAVDGRAFHSPYDPDDAKLARPTLDLSRFRIAVDDGRIVAVAGSFALELTLPGLGLLPVSGVTWVAVEVSHRRQGILRQLMTALDEAASEENEPILALGASEGSIYERFGYGVCNRLRHIEIDRRVAAFRPEHQPPPGTIQIRPAAEVVDDLLERWDHYRRATPGEVTLDRATLDQLVGTIKPPLTAALHADGFALWSVTGDWNQGLPNGAVDIALFAAASPEARKALWHTILSIDLVGPIRSVRAVSESDSLSSWLVNPRELRTRALVDNLWLKVIDPITAFEARAYRVPGRVVVACAEQVTIKIAADATGTVTVDQSDEDPDIELAPSAIGPVLMGSASIAGLIDAGIASVADRQQIGVLDAFFGWGTAPVTRREF